MNMRTFLAIEFPSEIQNRMAKLLADLRDVPEKIKWVEPENFHLTIKFLGPTPVEKKEAISAALRRVVRNIASFPISLEGVGGFPSLSHARVIWVGLKEGAASVVSLAKAVEETLQPLGFPPEDREFSPHATLGRVKAPIRSQVLVQIITPHLASNFGHSTAKMLTWYQSTLTPHGPVYEVLEQIPFKTG